jgi:hypothetical protein
MRIGTGRLLLLIFTVALLVVRPVAAATVRHLEVTHNKQTYLIAFDVLLTAEQARVRKFLSDSTQWPRLSHQVREGHLLKTFPDGGQRVGLSFRSCVLIFCKTIRQVKDVRIRPNGDIFTVMVREQGDFDSGWERWQIRAEGDKTRVQYHATLVPSSGVLPLIGPWIVGNTLRRMLLDAANKLEVLAAT